MNTVSISSWKDASHIDGSDTVVAMNRLGGRKDCEGMQFQIAAILSTPMCIDDKEDVGMRLLTPRVVSPLECSTESAKGTMLETELASHRRVGFSDNVSVMFIPRRSDYPKDLREQLFPNKKEISRNAARNMKEYAAEGFDWRNVIEDQEMYIDASGNRIHPIHKIWAKRKAPLPSKTNLPKPTPQRPMHPMRRDPVSRPSTPSPRFSAEFD